MVATVKVNEVNGVSPTYTPIGAGETVTYARFCIIDSATPGLDNPCVIPPSSVYFSFWKTFCLDLAGTFTRINNVRIYCDGAIGWTFGTNGAVKIALRDAGDHGCPISTDYEQAAGAGDTGYDIHDVTNGHDYYKDQTAVPVDIETYTSGSPCTIDTTNHEAAEKTKAAVMQLTIDNDAVQGDQPDEDITILFDEI